MPARQVRVLVPFALCALCAMCTLCVLCVLGATLAPLTAFALGTGPQAAAPDSQATTPIETALIEHRCNVSDTPSAGTDTQRQCLEAQLASLRGDFGRDLGRLSASDRRNMDAACSRLHPSEQRGAYLGCLSEQLAAWHQRHGRGSLAAPEVAAATPSLLLAPEVTPATATPPPASRWLTVAIGGAAGLGLAAVGFVFFTAKSRRVRRKCRVCGVDIPDSDLCTTCRHEAADALRRAAADRAHDQTAPPPKEEDPNEEEPKEEVAKKEDADQGATLAAAVPAVPIIPIIPAGPALATPPVLPDAVFDPYVVLGVSPNAGQDDVHAAYEQARTKYHPDLVSHLGEEAQGAFPGQGAVCRARLPAAHRQRGRATFVTEESKPISILSFGAVPQLP